MVINGHKLISPWTKWSPFHRRYFKMHFQEWQDSFLDEKFTGGGVEWHFEEKEKKLYSRNNIPEYEDAKNVLVQRNLKTAAAEINEFTSNETENTQNNRQHHTGKLIRIQVPPCPRKPPNPLTIVSPPTPLAQNVVAAVDPFMDQTILDLSNVHAK